MGPTSNCLSVFIQPALLPRSDLSLCNTPGVCHQLSSGFELKHGILSDDENVKVKPIETSPNLNLDVAPLLYI
jgi:hypothetical protein